MKSAVLPHDDCNLECERSKNFIRYVGRVVILLSLLLSGCSDSNRSQIVGVWEIKTADKLLDRIDSDSENDIAVASKMTIEFRRDGSLLTTTQMGSIDRTKEGQWELLGMDASSKLAKVRCVIGMQETETEIEIISADTIKMVPPNMAGLSMKLVFERSKNN